jgi:hypothetical protein
MRILPKLKFSGIKSAGLSRVSRLSRLVSQAAHERNPIYIYYILLSFYYSETVRQEKKLFIYV